MHLTRNPDNTGTLHLEGELVIERAAPLLKTLRQALDECDSIAIECSQIRAVDLSCLQLLCSAHRTAVAHGKRFFFAGERPDFLNETMRQAGFIRMQKCQMNPSHQDCLWLGGTSNE